MEGSNAAHWEGWADTLRQFADASGTLVSAHDTNGQRQLGPYPGSSLGRMLAASGLFEPGSPGGTAVAALITETLTTGLPIRGEFEGLHVWTMPMHRTGTVAGCVVFGWVPISFGSALGAERLGRAAGIDGRRLWSELRLHSPVPEHRFATHAALLASILESGAHLRDAIGDLNRLATMREQFLARVAHDRCG